MILEAWIRVCVCVCVCVCVQGDLQALQRTDHPSVVSCKISQKVLNSEVEEQSDTGFC